MTINLFSIKVLGIGLILVSSFMTTTCSARADSIEPARGGSGAPGGTVGGSSRLVSKLHRFSGSSAKNIEFNLSLSSEVNPSLQSFVEPWFP